MEQIIGLVLGFYFIIGFTYAINRIGNEPNPISQIIISSNLNCLGKFLSVILAVGIMPSYLITRGIMFVCTKRGE